MCVLKKEHRQHLYGSGKRAGQRCCHWQVLTYPPNHLHVACTCLPDKLTNRAGRKLLPIQALSFPHSLPFSSQSMPPYTTKALGLGGQFECLVVMTVPYIDPCQLPWTRRPSKLLTELPRRPHPSATLTPFSSEGHTVCQGSAAIHSSPACQPEGCPQSQRSNYRRP